MPRDAGCLTDGEMSYDSSSRIEPKRGQWFMEPDGPQSFNKKHAIEAVNGRPVPQMNVPPAPWDTTSGFQSVPVQCNERLFGSEPMRADNLVERHIQCSGNMNMGRKGYESLFGSNPSVGLSMSHTIEEDPSSGLSFGGIRKVKVNQVRDSEHIMTAPMEHSCCRVDNGSIDIGSSYDKSDNNNNNNISVGPSYNSGGESSVSMVSSYPKTDESYISAGNTFNKGDGDFISIGHSYSNGNNGMLSMGQHYDKGGRNFISVGQSYEKGDGNMMSLSTSYNKGHEDFISIGSSYGKSNESFVQMAPCYLKGNENIISMAPSYKAESSVVQMSSSYDKGESRNLSMRGQSYNKNESTTISFGGFHEESETITSGGIISGYDLLMSNQNSSQSLEVSEQKNSVGSNLDPVLNSISKADNGPKNKEPKTAKKPPTNNFPSNVKSLLSTGMFDGIPVKYVSWSRDVSFLSLFKKLTN